MKKSSCKMKEVYEAAVNLVVGIRYGSEGIIPCHVNCSDSCVSSSGDSFCGGHLDHKEIEVNGSQLFIVRCQEGVKCSQS